MLRDKPLHNFLFETDDTGFYRNLDTYCTPWIDTCCLLHLIRSQRPSNLLEIGTHRGYTTRLIAQRFPKLAITTVDPGDQILPADRPSNQVGEYLGQSEIGIVVADMPNVEVIKHPVQEIDWGNRQFDFVWIDANHTYRHVLDDSRLALRLLRSPGTIVWHDHNNVADVGRALGELDTPNDIVWLHNTWIAYLIT